MTGRLLVRRARARVVGQHPLLVHRRHVDATEAVTAPGASRVLAGHVLASARPRQRLRSAALLVSWNGSVSGRA